MSQWQFRGPTGTPFSGRINAIAVHPTDSATLYVGAAGGGLWKSTDGGGSWAPLSNDWQFQPVSSIAIDPRQPETIYAGTGDFDGWGTQTFGIMKSSDGGASFTNLAVNESLGKSVSSIIVDPEDSTIVTMTTGRGSLGVGQVFRSTTSGASWSPVIAELAEWKQLVIGRPGHRGLRSYYACGWHSDGTPALYRSETRGATWTKITDSHAITAVAPSTTTATGVYGMGSDKTVRYSPSGGDPGTWVDISGNLTQIAVDWGQFSYDSYLRCLAIEGKDRLILANKHLFQWDGNSWSGVSTELHEDQHDLRPDPSSPNRVFFGNDGGVWSMTFYASTQQWSPWNGLNSGLGVTQIYRAGISQQHATVMDCGTQDNGVYSSQGSPTKWTEYGSLGLSGDVFAALVSPANDQVQFAAVGPPGVFHGLYRTGDRWHSHKDITPSSYDETLLAMDAAGTTLYLANDFLFSWSEATQSWTPQLGGQQLVGVVGQHRHSAIAVSPSDGQRVYTGSVDGELWMGEGPDWTWTRIEPGAPSLPSGGISAISVNPSNANDVLVALDVGPRRLWRCTNVTAAPRIWVDVTGKGSPLPNENIWTIRDAHGLWFVGTDVGVFQSIDGGATWLDITIPAGLPRLPVRDLGLAPGTLMAATYGRGAWTLDLVPHLGGMVERTTHLLLLIEALTEHGIHVDPQPGDKHAARAVEQAAREARQALSSLGAALARLSRS